MKHWPGSVRTCASNIRRR